MGAVAGDVVVAGAVVTGGAVGGTNGVVVSLTMDPPVDSVPDGGEGDPLVAWVVAALPLEETALGGGPLVEAPSALTVAEGTVVAAVGAGSCGPGDLERRVREACGEETAATTAINASATASTAHQRG